ncbi:MAG: hypothetical protein IPJ23_02975 [Ignavibacteriales bacterium]|nr:hypothetical protein [Ignavibacteriales bacterium]
MINNEEKFYSYLSGKMNPDEKIRFENDLNQSSDLNAEFIKYKNVQNFIDEVKDVRLNNDYTESLITNFRNSLNSKNTKRKSPIIKYAFETLVVAVVGYFLISSFDKETPQNIQSLVSDYSEAELDSFSNNYHFSSNSESNITEYDANVLDSIYNANFSAGLIESISKNKMADILNINNVSNVDEYLSDNDIDEIYAQLIDKEIL